MVADLDIQLLRSLATLADAGSFTRAARLLRLSQPAVTQQIQRLEEQVGKQLVDRRRRRIRLTEAGEVLLGYARSILRLSEDATDRLRDSALLSGRVRLGITEHAVGRLPPLLARFAGCHPRVSLAVEVDSSRTLGRSLREGRLDLAVTTIREEGARCRFLFAEGVVWAGAPGFDPREHDPLPLVVFSRTCRLRHAAIERLDAVERRWRVAFSSSSLSGVRSAAAAGLGLATLFQSTLTEPLIGFSQAHGLPPLSDARVGLHRSRRHPSRATQALDDFIVEHFEGQAAGRGAGP